MRRTGECLGLLCTVPLVGTVPQTGKTAWEAQADVGSPSKNCPVSKYPIPPKGSTRCSVLCRKTSEPADLQARTRARSGLLAEQCANVAGSFSPTGSWAASDTKPSAMCSRDIWFSVLVAGGELLSIPAGYSSTCTKEAGQHPVSRQQWRQRSSKPDVRQYATASVAARQLT